jgi:hypothetical protein
MKEGVSMSCPLDNPDYCPYKQNFDFEHSYTPVIVDEIDARIRTILGERVDRVVGKEEDKIERLLKPRQSTARQATANTTALRWPWVIVVLLAGLLAANTAVIFQLFNQPQPLNTSQEALELVWRG